MSTENLTNEDLRLKAAGINFAVFTISDEITKTLQKQVKDLGNLKQDEINKVFFVISYVLLFQAQKFFWENFIQDEEKAKVFLFKMKKKQKFLRHIYFVCSPTHQVLIQNPI